jgi:hypothetical protein
MTANAMYEIPVDEMTPGLEIIADAGFACIAPGAKRIVQSAPTNGGLYVKCSHGKHYLDGQFNATETHYVGFIKADAKLLPTKGDAMTREQALEAALRAYLNVPVLPDIGHEDQLKAAIDNALAAVAISGASMSLDRIRDALSDLLTASAPFADQDARLAKSREAADRALCMAIIESEMPEL